MFVQHAHNEVRIVKKFCFINKSHIMSAVSELVRYVDLVSNTVSMHRAYDAKRIFQHSYRTHSACQHYYYYYALPLG